MRSSAHSTEGAENTCALGFHFCCQCNRGRDSYHSTPSVTVTESGTWLLSVTTPLYPTLPLFLPQIWLRNE